MRSMTKFLALAAFAAVLSPAFAETTIEKEFPLAAGGALILQTDGGAVTVVGQDRSTVKIVITTELKDPESDYSFTYDTTPQQVKLVVKRRGGAVGGWFGSWSGKNLSFRVEMPRSASCTVSTAGGPIRAEGLAAGADLSTSGGPVTVQRVTGTVKADTSGGPIEIEEVDGTVNADTSGGPIRISKVTGDISADTSGGGIEISEAGGRVDADTSGGPISVRFAAANFKGGSLDTSGGGITIEVDPAAKLSLDASTSGGSVSCDLPVTVVGDRERSELKGDINGGGALLRARSSGGGIRIRAR